MFWLSFVDRALDLLGVQVQELQLAGAGPVVERYYPSLSPDRPALVGELDKPGLCQRLRARLAQAYPESHEVTVLSGLDTGSPALHRAPLSQLDQGMCQGVSLLYLPPVDCPSSVETFQSTVAHLRALDGCPWDREQTHQSLRKGFLEETYEVLDALDQGDLELLKEELGDVLLHILLQAQIASEHGEFSMGDVVCHVNTKIVYRHPHVFSDLAVEGVDQVLDNWEALKRKEKGRDHTSSALFEGIPRALPALARAQALLRRAEKREGASTDWERTAERVAEAAHGLAAVQDETARAQSMGDLLFELTALAAGVGIDAEGALRDANARYEQRVLAAAIESLEASE
jgi:tetrapyrrole methylase family protein/MazG family protein